MTKKLFHMFLHLALQEQSMTLHMVIQFAKKMLFKLMSIRKKETRLNISELLIFIHHSLLVQKQAT